MELNKIIHGDAYEILPTLPDKSFDTVIIDPPYGYKMAEWDMPVDIAFVIKHIGRIGRDFLAVFGQMPYLREWDKYAEKEGLYFKSHIVWVKRVGSPYGAKIKRTHEDIFIYSFDKKPAFNKVTGRYEDVKVPGILFDVITLDSIQRYISDLWFHIQNGEGRIKKASFEGTHKTRYKSRFDTQIAKRDANITDVWSFLPESMRTYNKGGKFHPTMKPVLLEMRLVELLTQENGSVLDCFSGSGTTAVACQRLNRQFFCIEKEQEFYEHSVERLAGDVWQPELDMNMN